MSAKRDIAEHVDAERRFRALERGLADGDDVLAVRCALGAAHVAVLATLSARARAGEPAEPSEDEVERVIRASLAAWKAAGAMTRPAGSHCVGAFARRANLPPGRRYER